MHLAALILSAALSLFSGGATAALSADSHAILVRGQSLFLEDQEAQAKADLEKYTRSKLVSALSEGLRAGGETAQLATRIASNLKVHEVLPDIEKLLETSDDWVLFSSVINLAEPSDQKHLTELFLNRLEAPKDSSAAVPDETKVSILGVLGTWKIPLSKSLFEKNLNDDNFQVQKAAARQFTLSRGTFQISEQVDRFEKIFVMKPYQVRIDGMFAFESLPAADRLKLKAAVGPKFKSACAAEQNEKVKKECESILSQNASDGSKEAVK